MLLSGSGPSLLKTLRPVHSILIGVCLFGGFGESAHTNRSSEYNASGRCLTLLGTEDNMYGIRYDVSILITLVHA